jgi:DNA polymerase (family 10)
VIGNQFEEGQDGELIATRTPYGTPLAVHPSTPDGFGTILFKSTGPRLHVERIGDPGPLPTEEAVYASVDSPWVPPSAREVEGTIPDSLVMSSSIRGDLHVHSQASPDGRLSVDEIAALLASRGYEFGAITDHTWGLRFGGLDPEALGGQRALIDAVNSNRSDLILLHGAEVNIDKEGGLDIPDEVLATLDLVVAGVHSAFGLPRSEQTARVIRAIRNPRVRILAHPTGRRVGMRAPLDLDLESVIAAAIEEGVALEVNGHRDRLDLSSDLAGAAVGAGALVVANSDAHRVDELGNVSNAVATLQRAAVTTERVVNAWGSQALLDWARHMA